jgi:Tol biopolymer transport system component
VTDAERRRRVEHVCDAALDRDPRERAAFVVAACGGDEALRREAEVLLAHAQAAEGFLAAPIGAVAAQVLGEEPVASLVGRRVGAYQIVSHLGTGGMGEVYRARDATLNRDIALKILPELVALDLDRLARFRREAQVLAALNHPNIAAIYGFEESNPSPGPGQAAVRALVLELVEGPTLADRIAHGPIPVDEALPIARQIAEALEAAHEQGIIHRDLKPANIKVRADGRVKVLDFGLAKALEPAGSSPGTPQSPTITGVGVILGTAAYMSPEQARGKAVDKRADIWAFGCVVYEMLTGHRAFGGEDVAVTLACVVEREPDFDAFSPSVPARVRQALRVCLRKDPKQRAGDISDVRLVLEGAFEMPAPQTAAPPAVAAPRSVVVRALPWALVATSVVAIVAGLLAWAPWRSAPVLAPRTLLASIGADASLTLTPLIGTGAPATLSPDGTTLAFVAQQAGQTRLFVRKLDQLQATGLAGTEGAAAPFFSPDGQWVAFFAGGQLKKIAVTGGAAIKLCDATAGRGGTWTDDDAIIFTPANTLNTTLMRVSAAGGTASVFGTLNQGAATQRWPQALPDGTSVLYTEHSSINNFDGASLVIAPLSGGTPKVVVRGGYYGRFVRSGRASTTHGHLIYMNQGTLFAVPFDLDRLETVGTAVPALGRVARDSGTGGVQLAVSSDGTLVYVPGRLETTAHTIDWITRDGKTSVLRAAKTDWRNPRFSPDGQKLAIDISDGKQHDIWVYEWARDTLTQLTFDPGEDRNPVWTPDGRRIVFASDRAKPGKSNLYWVNADGTGVGAQLIDSPDNMVPWSWHPSGKFLAFHVGGGATSVDLMILPMEGDAARGWRPGKPTVFLSTPAVEAGPMFSPDGRWITYVSTEAGSIYDVYVRPFPGPGGGWRVSTAGGNYPRWSGTTHEVMFLAGTLGQIMAAPYAVVGDAFRAETPQIWSPTNVQGAGTLNSAYDLHPDGVRVAASAGPNQSSVVEDKVVFVFNFADYLSTIAPRSQ